MKLTLLYLFLFSFLIASCTEEDCAKEFLKIANQNLSKVFDKYEHISWNFLVNQTNTNKIALTEWQINMAQIKKDIRTQLLKFSTSKIESPDTLRQIQLLTNIGDDILPKETSQELAETIHNMVQLYVTTTISSCRDPRARYTIKEIRDIFSVSVNRAELECLWTSFITKLGTKILPYFPRYVNLKNEAAHMFGVPSANVLYDQLFEEPDVHQLTRNLMYQLKPFYEQIHAFVRFSLRKFYGNPVVQYSHLPVHLLGDIEATNFQWMARNAVPYENLPRSSPDYKKQFKKTREELYQLADEFFVSINLSPMPQYVWNNSIFDRQGNEQSCHPTVSFSYKSYKILDCTTPEDLSSLTNVFFCASTVQLLLQTEHQPYSFRSDALMVLPSAMGNLIELSAQSSKCFRSIARENITYTEMDALNRLFVEAMETVPSFISSYVLMKWRWDVFDRFTDEDDYNGNWWDLMLFHLGLLPPTERPVTLLDAAVRYNLILGETIQDKMLAKIVSHQLHKELCLKTGEYVPGDPKKPLHECCLYGHKIVGDLLRDGLRAGKSKKWSYILKVVTGKEEISGDALLEYYEPLNNWLVETNMNNSEHVGWMQPRTIATKS